MGRRRRHARRHRPGDHTPLGRRVQRHRRLPGHHRLAPTPLLRGCAPPSTGAPGLDRGASTCRHGGERSVRTGSRSAAGGGGRHPTSPGGGARGPRAVHLPLDPVTAGEIRWLYARSMRRGLEDDPPFDDSWEPPVRTLSGGRRSPAVLAPLTDAVVREGGGPDDEDRPHHRRYVRIDTAQGTAFQTALALADMPHDWTFPGGGGEWLHHLDDLAFPLDWAVRIRSVANAEAQVKVRRQHRQLIGQVDEYDGEVTGAPPSLAEAIAAVDDQRAELAANPAEPELQATIIVSVAAGSLAALEDQASTLLGFFEPHDYAFGRPTGGQLALLRSMLPGTAAAPVCRDYTQYLLPRDLAAGAPFCGSAVGDPAGLLLGTSLDTGTSAPVLLDPAYGPQVGRTASLAVVGALGSGKSYFLKRICWDTIARGGQVVTIDRSSRGEYAAFARVAPGRAHIVRLGSDAEVCLDPLRTFTGESRTGVTLGFLSLLAGCSPHTEEGAALAEAVYQAAQQPQARLGDVLEALHRMGDDTKRDDPAAQPRSPPRPLPPTRRRSDRLRRCRTGHPRRRSHRLLGAQPVPPRSGHPDARAPGSADAAGTDPRQRPALPRRRRRTRGRVRRPGPLRRGVVRRGVVTAGIAPWPASRARRHPRRAQAQRSHLAGEPTSERPRRRRARRPDRRPIRVPAVLPCCWHPGSRVPRSRARCHDDLSRLRARGWAMPLPRRARQGRPRPGPSARPRWPARCIRHDPRSAADTAGRPGACL